MWIGIIKEMQILFLPQGETEYRLSHRISGHLRKMANLTSEFIWLSRRARFFSSLPLGHVKLREEFVKAAPMTVPGAAYTRKRIAICIRKH